MITPSAIGLPSKFPRFRSTGVNQFDLAYDIVTSTTRFDILGAPPGMGKSLVNMAVAALHENKRVLYLVSTNPLLDQVYKDFESMGVAVIKGMGNYRCNDARQHTDRKVMCNEGKCTIGHSCSLRTSGCDYFDAVGIAKDARIDLSNFAYRASCARYSDPTAIGEFDLVICDEAHLLLDWMSDFCAITLDRRTLSNLLEIKLPDFASTSMYSNWAGKCLVTLDNIVELMGVENSHDRSLTQFAELRRDLETLSQIEDEPWVVESWRYGVRLTPVEPGQFLERYIYLDAPKILLCSASLSESDAPSFNCNNDFTFHPGGDGFPVARRPIWWIPTVSVNYKISEDDLNKWITTIDNIIDLGLDYRGIIHTVSYGRMRYIFEHSRHADHMIIHGTKNSNDSWLRQLPSVNEALEKFFDDELAMVTLTNGVLVSPIVDTGYDFKYDRARWQIISKVKFLNPTNPLIRARMNLWQRKYNLDYLTVMATKNTLQTYGRVSRADDDWGITYVVDDAWGRRVSRCASNPPWFTAAMQTCWQGLPPMEVPQS